MSGTWLRGQSAQNSSWPPALAMPSWMRGCERWVTDGGLQCARLTTTLLPASAGSWALPARADVCALPEKLRCVQADSASSTAWRLGRCPSLDCAPTAWNVGLGSSWPHGEPYCRSTAGLPLTWPPSPTPGQCMHSSRTLLVAAPLSLSPPWPAPPHRDLHLILGARSNRAPPKAAWRGSAAGVVPCLALGPGQRADSPSAIDPCCQPSPPEHPSDLCSHLLCCTTHFRGRSRHWPVCRQQKVHRLPPALMAGPPQAGLDLPN